MIHSSVGQCVKHCRSIWNLGAGNPTDAQIIIHLKGLSSSDLNAVVDYCSQVPSINRFGRAKLAHRIFELGRELQPGRGIIREWIATIQEDSQTVLTIMVGMSLCYGLVLSHHGVQTI